MNARQECKFQTFAMILMSTVADDDLSRGIIAIGAAISLIEWAIEAWRDV